MTQRQNMPCVLQPSMVIGSPHPDSPAIHRVARRIFSRHLNEGDPITWEQAKIDAERAWNEVNQWVKPIEVTS